MIGWYGVPRTASFLLTVSGAIPPDLSFFCDRRIDARIARALELEATDPERRGGAVGEDRARHRRPCALGTPVHAVARYPSSPSAWATTSTTPSWGSCSISSGCDSGGRTVTAEGRGTPQG